jgi:hypothetical protein
MNDLACRSKLRKIGEQHSIRHLDALTAGHEKRKSVDPLKVKWMGRMNRGRPACAGSITVGLLPASARSKL